MSIATDALDFFEGDVAATETWLHLPNEHLDNFSPNAMLGKGCPMPVAVLLQHMKKEKALQRAALMRKIN